MTNEEWLRAQDMNTSVRDFGRLFEALIEAYERIANLEGQVEYLDRRLQNLGGTL